ncbi:DEAD/DEAH box helicase [Carnobacterium maltaromaticum]|uniref:DEAD/DEAH box helicase n=1 Tax=Carnobacterium maltaromaticum TaxID=2751 RepID=UPI001071DF2D|nr:DEAD/DEAH box helicase [Carnobacterium maltaromaticum]TFJ76601.1 RNA helicase [Carnobacterium maltaromaticum]TFJ79401.1 RNA helicase [Carnobacterium maltaromaticum]
MGKKEFADYGIGEDVLKALNGLGYFQPTKVQEEVIPVALADMDVIVTSQTGSGKTASFGIPLCEKILWEENRPQALVLVPTRELALQVNEDIANIGRFRRIKATSVFGKASFERQKSELKQKSHIVVGTPGRVLDHLKKGTFPVDKLEYLILDEADEMLNMGFIDQVEEIIGFLPKERQTLLFSATMPVEVERLASHYMKDEAVSIKIETTEDSKPKILKSFLMVSGDKKMPTLLDLLTVENPDSCIVFCNRQETVNNVYEYLNKAGLPVDKLHGGMIQEDRFDVMDDFRKGKFRYLVATDVAARGIDVDNITHVVNYDVPVEKESFVHRIGRTGRAGKTGVALTLVEPYEKERWAEIKRYSASDVSEITAPSARFVLRHKPAFEKKIAERPRLKKDKGTVISQDITKLYFNGGKKKKIRAIDFVGTISKIPGIQADDIGIITIGDQGSYVEILNGKGPLVLNAMKTKNVKGKTLKVNIARRK